MSLKDFIEQGGHVILHSAEDLQRVVAASMKLGLPTCSHYTLLGTYPFWYCVKNGRPLSSQEAVDIKSVMEPSDFCKLVDSETPKGTEVSPTTFVKCESERQYKIVADYFSKKTRSKEGVPVFCNAMPYFNLANGRLYPIYCVPEGANKISFDEFLLQMAPQEDKLYLKEMCGKGAQRLKVINSLLDAIGALKELLEAKNV